MTSTSNEGKPPCYGLSYKNTSVTHREVVGGWSNLDDDPTRAMRCATCPHEIACQDAARKAFPADYVS